MLRPAILLLALALTACGSDSDPGPGEITVGQARDLNQAAAATDINATADPGNASE